jgi:DNA-directed RNA polymerase subunit H (RpoH/RPB5)
MVVDGRYTATVDRVVEKRAVVLIERDGEVVDERSVSVGRLPEAARRDGAVLDVEVRDGELQRIRYDEETTDERRDAMRDRFDRLAERPPESRDDKPSENGG